MSDEEKEPYPEADGATAFNELEAWVVKWRAHGPHVLLGSLISTAVRIARALPLSRAGFLGGAASTWDVYEAVKRNAADRN